MDGPPCSGLCHGNPVIMSWMLPGVAVVPTTPEQMAVGFRLEGLGTPDWGLAAGGSLEAPPAGQDGTWKSPGR